MARDASKVQISATVTPDVKSAVAERAEAEDREPGAVVRRALLCYLALDLDAAEAAVRAAKASEPSA